MTEVKRGDKSAKIREMLIQLPNGGNKEIAEMITNAGIPCKAVDVGNMKQRLKGGSNTSAVTADDLVKFKATVAEHGGLESLTAKVDAAKTFLDSLGSLERFKAVREQYESLVG